MDIRTIRSTAAKVGQHVATVSSRESGMRTVLSGRVLSVEHFTIKGRNFADVKLDTGTTLSGDCELTVLA